jgi:hypothetical protein
VAGPQLRYFCHRKIRLENMEYLSYVVSLKSISVPITYSELLIA